jgi:hypothetical protein
MAPGWTTDCLVGRAGIELATHFSKYAFEKSTEFRAIVPKMTF